MTPAHITRLVTFAQHGEPKAYAASDMMRSDLETVLIDATKWQAYEARKQAAINAGLGRSPLRSGLPQPQRQTPAVNVQEQLIAQAQKIERLTKGLSNERAAWGMVFNEAETENDALRAECEKLRLGEIRYKVCLESMRWQINEDRIATPEEVVSYIDNLIEMNRPRNLK